MPHRLDLPHNVRPFAIKKLHADFYKGFFLFKMAEELQGLLRIFKIACNNHIMFFHLLRPPNDLL